MLPSSIETFNINLNMSVSQQIDGLLARVARDVEAIREYCSQIGGMLPKLRSHTAAAFVITCCERDLEADISTESRHASLEASFELQTLLMSPSDFIDLQVLQVRTLSPPLSPAFISMEIRCHLQALESL